MLTRCRFLSQTIKKTWAIQQRSVHIGEANVIGTPVDLNSEDYQVSFFLHTPEKLYDVIDFFFLKYSRQITNN